jgi:O-antigen ligase
VPWRLDGNGRGQQILEALVLGLLLLAANLRGLVISSLLLFSGAPLEVAIEFVLFLVALWLLASSSRGRLLWGILAGNLALVGFMGLAAVSVFWTIDIWTSVLRALALVLSTTLAAFMAARYARAELLRISVVLFGVLAILCVATVAAWRDVGMMNFYPYNGSWRGIFWHRNYLGATMALGTLVCLLAWGSAANKLGKWAAIYLVVYLLTMSLVVLSHSATGMILAIIVLVGYTASAAWLRWSPRMKAKQFAMLGVLLGASVAMAAARLDVLLGLFNRDSTFTGRVNLWKFLLREVISQRPLLGHGFGALWPQPLFQIALRDGLGWSYPIVIGDNGYIDIALHLGYVGLALLLAALVVAVANSARLARKERTLLASGPLLILIWVLLANVTLSYFLETESFTWFIAMAFAFTASVPCLMAQARSSKTATSADS